jgi:hypothetical protein
MAQHEKEQEVICLADTVDELPYAADVITLARNSLSTEALINKMKLSSADLVILQEKTKGQSSNPLWMKLRKGRITASNFYKVYTKIETLMKNPAASCDRLLQLLIIPTSLDHLPQIPRGKQLEILALDTLKTSLSRQGHISVRMEEGGLFIDAELVFGSQSRWYMRL